MKARQTIKDVIILVISVSVGLSTVYFIDKLIDEDKKAAARISNNVQEWQTFFRERTQDEY